MPPPRSSTHRLFGPLPGTAHTSFTLESCLGDWISVDETRCVPSPRHQHPMVARPTENFATNVRVVRTRLQDRAAKSEVRIAASHRQGAGNSSSSRGNCLANCSTEEFAPVEWPLHAAPRRIALSTSCPMRRTTEGDDIARSQTDCGMDDDGSRIRCESRNLTVAARLEASSELANTLRAGRGGRIPDLDPDARLRAARRRLESVRAGHRRLLRR